MNHICFLQNKNKPIHLYKRFEKYLYGKNKTASYIQSIGNNFVPMKITLLVLALGALVFVSSCDTLNLNPLSYGSSETWNSDASEIQMSLNGLYKDAFWPVDADEWTDDWMYRNSLSDITGGTINGQTGFVVTYWDNCYKAIARANNILSSLDRASGKVSAALLAQYKAEALFVRASQYSILISHFGNVVYYTGTLDLDESFKLSQTDKATVLKNIYQDYDSAAANLPVSYSSTDLKHATKGAAYAMKARIALYNSDWAVARDAAQKCIELGAYSLHPDYGNLFLSSTKNSVETIFGLPRSITLKVTWGDCQNYITRNPGGWGAKCPSWDLFCSYLCTDGLTIDKSPLFDPRNPFKNRDPRCAATIVEFQTPHLGYIYQPHPDSTMVLKISTNTKVSNKDCRSVNQYASYNGLVWKKGIDGDWLLNSYQVEPDKIIIRYADVLLMYAEAKIELNEIDQSVLDAINKVRARAYKVNYAQTTLYPAVTTTDRVELRKIVRTERRMEFALEGIRYMDIIRWKLAEKVLNKPNYGMLDPADLRTKIIKPGLWFFPQTPVIDDDGVADFTPMYNASLIKLITLRDFDATKQYLWPIPSKEILINSNLKQNPNY